MKCYLVGITVDSGTCAGVPLTVVDPASKDTPPDPDLARAESRARISSATTYLLGSNVCLLNQDRR
jgi:hypothetical protein